MKLISCTEFVLERELQNAESWEYEQIAKDCIAYAKFLRQPLKLEMFVPCDDDGNVLEEPTDFEKQFNKSVFNKWKQAKEKILFEGFEVLVATEVGTSVVNNELERNMNCYKDNTKITVENITSWGEKQIQLTKSATKQLGL